MSAPNSLFTLRRNSAPPRPEPTEAHYRGAAQRLTQQPTSIDIDSNAVVSIGDDDGAYVQAWVWVPKSDARTAVPYGLSEEEQEDEVDKLLAEAEKVCAIELPALNDANAPLQYSILGLRAAVDRFKGR